MKLELKIRTLVLASALTLLTLLSGCGQNGSASWTAPFPVPFTSLHLGMDEAEFHAAHPNAEQLDHEDHEDSWDFFTESPSEGPFEFELAEYILEDRPGTNRQLVAVILLDRGLQDQDKVKKEGFSGVLRSITTQFGKAQRRFKVIHWGMVLDVRAWVSGDNVAIFSNVARPLDPDVGGSATGRFMFLAFERKSAERNPVMSEGWCKGFLAGLARPPDEDKHPIAWVDPLPGTNWIERYVVDYDRVASKEQGDALLALVSDYDTFPFSVENANLTVEEKNKGFVEIVFSGTALDVDDPKAIHVSRDGSSLRVANADFLLFSVPKSRREALRHALDRIVSTPWQEELISPPTPRTDPLEPTTDH